MHLPDLPAPSASTQPPPGALDAATANSGDVESRLPALRQRLMRHARMAMHDGALAEDLVQDTLIVVVQQHGTRRGDASLVTWATAILKHKVADWYRSPSYRRMVQLTPEDGDHDAAIDALYNDDGAYVEKIPPWQDPARREEQRQMMTVLDRCVSALPELTGRVFMMREWLGFETAEICERLDVTADNCRQRLHRARMGLRKCMQRDWLDPQVVK